MKETCIAYGHRLGMFFSKLFLSSKPRYLIGYICDDDDDDDDFPKNDDFSERCFGDVNDDDDDFPKN
jgi:hypothetical protein